MRSSDHPHPLPLIRSNRSTCNIRDPASSHASNHNNVKTTITLLLAGIAALGAQAQPVLTHDSNAPVIGATYTMRYGDHVSPGAPGAQQTWDLSGLTTDSTSLVRILPVASTPNGNLFPNATYAEDDGGVITYFRSTPTGIQFAGSDDGEGTLITYSQMGRHLSFPCSFGSTWTDTEVGAFDLEDIHVDRSGTVTATADGYGTLVMPFGTIPNVLRVHWVNTGQDVMDLFTMNYTYDSYIYLTPGNQYPIAQLVTSSVAVLGNTQTVQFSRWVGSLSTDVAAIAEVEDGLHVFPNPATDELRFEVPADMGHGIRATITDARGQMVRDEPVTADSAPIDLRALHSGMYQLSLISPAGERRFARFTKH